MALSKSPLGAHFVSIWTPFTPPGDPSLLSIPSAPFRTPPPPSPLLPFPSSSSSSSFSFVDSSTFLLVRRERRRKSWGGRET